MRQTRLAAAAAGVVFVLYPYIELFVVDPICLWCTATAERDDARRFLV